MKSVCCFTALLSAVAVPAATNETAGSRADIAYSANISHTFDSRLERHDVNYGDFNATMMRASATKTWAFDNAWSLNAGPAFAYTRFDASSRAPIPGEGYVTAVQLGADWKINDKWGLRGDVRPGLYSDFQDISFGDFNAPFIAAVSYQVNPTLLAVLAIGVNLRSDLGTIGGPGVRWKPADRWLLNFIMPKPVVEFSLAPAVTLYGGGEWRTSSFRVGEDFGRVPAARHLSDDDFSYRELRALGGVRWRISGELVIDFEGGYALDRRAEYRDAEFEVDGGSAPFLQVGVGGSF
jgi:hypothetical protein